MRTLSAAAAVLLALALPGAVSADPVDPTDDPLQQRIDPDQEIASDDAVLDTGHVDLGPRYQDGEWTLMVHDDSELEGSVWRHLDRTVVRITDTAVQQVPDDPAYSFLGADPGAEVHVVPQTQDPEVVWLGWNTQDSEVMETVDRGVTLTLEGVEGPGHVVVYLQDGGFGEPDVLWDSRTPERQDLWVDVNTHTHANWVFSEPGTYLVPIAATATMVDGSEQTATGTVRFAVGSDTDPEEALAAEASAPAPGEASTAPPAAEAEDGSGADEDGSAPWMLIGAAGAGALVVALLVVLGRGRRARAAALRDGGAS